MGCTDDDVMAAALTDAEDHDDGCSCGDCAWLDAHYRARSDARASRAAGGLSSFGHEVLGRGWEDVSC